MDHPFESLGPERFQQLCQAFLVKEFPGMSCFPVGQPDGGRDALQHLAPKVGTSQEHRNIVFQVKYARTTPKDVDAWVLSAANGEVEKVERLKQRGATSYYFISNIVGTAHLNVGSIDRIQTKLESLLGLPVVTWWRDDLNRRLDGNWDIKLRYPEMLTGQDFFRLLVEQQGSGRSEARTRAIGAFIKDQYLEDEDVKFKQVELHNKLLDLFVDLPFKVEFKRAHRTYALSPHANLRLGVEHVMGGGQVISDASGEEEVLGGTASLLLAECVEEFLDQLVVEGAPGQGKSTLLQYLCQVHRIRILNKEDELKRLPPDHAIAPVFLPFKIDLRDLSEWLSGNDPFASTPGSAVAHAQPKTLEAFVAHLVMQGSGGIEFTVADLVAVAKDNPILLALDGLDEVADIRRRSEVVSAVTKASNRLRENSKRLRVIITSRPAVFANSHGFDAADFPHLQLGSVKKAQINVYAERWLNARGIFRRERAEFEKTLAEKLDLPHLRDLARNPMQLAILLSLILTQGDALPDRRTSLYDHYVTLFFSRESSKDFSVRQHLELLKDIHRYLAWKLHTATESGRSSATGRFTTEQLKSELGKYLEAEGQSTAIIEEIFTATVARVFMIVSRIEGSYEFEVQPLREYFAARYLYDTAPYSPPGSERAGTKPDRFEAVARNFYWLNVARFLCGCFSKGELFDLADRVRLLTSDGDIGRTRHPVALASTLLSDRVFSQSPRALEHLATGLAERRNLYRLLPVDYWNSAATLKIPPDSGGGSIVSKAREWILEENVQFDLRERLGTFISANSDVAELIRWWIEARKQIGKTSRWLAIGDALGIFAQIGIDDLKNQLGSERLDRFGINALWGTRGLAAMLRDEEDSKQLEWFLLNGVRWMSGVQEESPVHLAPHILCELPYMAATEDSDIFYYLLRQYEECAKPQSSDRWVSDCESKCQSFSISSCKLLNEAENLNDRKLWSSIIEDARAKFGDAPVVFYSALPIANMRGWARGRPKALSLLDRSRPLADRLRFAKFQSKNAEWWITTGKLADSYNDKILWLISLLAFFPLHAIEAAQVEIGALLDAWPEKEFDDMSRFLCVGMPPVHLTPNSFAAPVAPSISSPKLALLLAMRMPDRYGQTAFLEHFVSTESRSSAIERLRQGEAIKAAFAGLMEWKEALGVVEEVYSHGEFFSAGMAIAHQRVARKFVLPTEVVTEILEKAHAFPADLVDAAIAEVTQQVSRRVKSVGGVAKKEHWFH